MAARARAQEETRRRIVEATMQLHEEIGPRATTISAIAERAGVQRLTVYRHFPDEAAVFQACTAHWLMLNPPPDPSEWETLGEPQARLDAAFMAFCDYYAATRAMWSTAHRDVPDVPALQKPMAQFGAYVGGVADGLAAGFATSDPALRTTIGHALAFPTWDDLEARGLSSRQKADLLLRWVDGILGGGRSDA